MPERPGVSTRDRESVAAGPRDTSAQVGLVVCDGCCCGKRGLDTERLRHLAETRPDVASLRTSGCLGSCEHADVVVVRPSRAGRARGARPVWLGLVDDDALVAVEQWVTAGGPGMAPAPTCLAFRAITPARPDRAAG